MHFTFYRKNFCGYIKVKTDEEKLKESEEIDVEENDSEETESESETETEMKEDNLNEPSIFICWISCFVLT